MAQSGGIDNTKPATVTSDIADVMARYGLADRVAHYPVQSIPPAQAKSELLSQLNAEELSSGLLYRRMSWSWRQLRDQYGGDLPANLALNHFEENLSRDPTDYIFIDTETTGLSTASGTLAFLTGVLQYADSGHWVLHQYLLTEFDAERAMLDELDKFAKVSNALVTYNGKCFDYPLLQTRYRMAAKNIPFFQHRHVDLVHHVRRMFKSSWENCKLQTAEQQLFDMHRIDDIPGEEVPLAWHAFKQQGETVNLIRTVEHNALDLFSLAALSSQLLAYYDSPSDPVTALGAAKWAERNCDETKQMQVLNEFSSCAHAEYQWYFSTQLKRQGQWGEAEKIWLELLGTPYDHHAAFELAKYYEHKKKDIIAALHYAKQLLVLEAGNHAHQHRLQRLREKLVRQYGK